MDDLVGLFGKLLDAAASSGPVLEWYASCALHGWLRITALLAVSLAHLCIAAELILVLRRRQRGRRAGGFCVLATFLLAGGVLYGLEVLIWWRPTNLLLAPATLGAALVLVCSATVLLPMVPRMLSLRDPVELQREFDQRRRTELELRQVHAQLEGVIEQRTAELAKKTEEMEQFLNTVSHDLKNPIVTCLGLAGMLREDVKAGRIGQTLDSVDRIERSVTRMRLFIEDLLNLSRVGQVPFVLTTVDTNEIVRSIGDDLRHRLEQAGVVLEIEDNLPVVNADTQRLTEVLENLITNAMKYGCDNPHPRITVGCIAEGEESRIFVRDNGRGIAQEHQAQIFEPFRRLRSDKEGSGIGLTIVMRIVKKHGGRVWVESEPGHGSTFWIALPAVDEQIGAETKPMHALT
jgi:signal transduction histidine kinase